MTIPNFSDFGLTSALWADDDTTLTYDAQQRVSAAADSLALINDYTQGTNANKPLYSRADNKGNLLRQSHTVASWTNYVGVGTPSGALVTANVGTGARGMINTTTAFQSNMAVAGVNLRLVAEVEYVNHEWCWIGNGGDSSWRGVRFNLSTGLIDASFNITSSSVETISAGRYKITILMPIATTSNFSCYVTFGTSTIANGSTSITAAGTEQIKVHYGVGQQESWDTEPLETTDYPQYAGVNGRRCLVFNGAQTMTNASTLASVYTTTDSLQYVVVYPFSLTALEYITRSSPGGIIGSIYANTNSFRLYGNDGSNKFTTSPAATAGSVYIIRARKTGGNLIIGIDSGSGFVDGTPTACGASSALTSTLAISATSNGFYGKIGGILTANTGIAKPNLEALLRQNVFARSKLKLDLFTGQLKIYNGQN